LEEKWLSGDFIDDGHFSKSGGFKFAEIVAQFIRRGSGSGLFKRRTRQNSKLD
jgi:hypothetical protein